MKKLLFLGPSFDYYKGGSEYQYKILEQQLEGKYEIFYLFEHSTAIHKKQYLTYNYRLRKAYNPNIYTDSLVIYRLIKRLSPDIIYKRGVNYIAAVGIRYAKSHRVKMVLHISHQLDVEKAMFQVGSKCILGFLENTIAKYVIANANKVICQAEYQNNLLKANYGRSCDLILPNFHPIPTNILKKSLPIKVVWAANYKNWKQPEIFVELAEHFRNSSNTKFIMIGRSGPMEQQKMLFEKISRLPNIEYMGELSIEEVNAVLSEAHIFVNTSKYEGFPNTYIQAWMRKVPVVTLNCDPDDLIKTNGMGFHSQTFQQMVRDVRNLVKNEQLREQMGEKSREFACTTFSVSNIETFVNLMDQA